MDEVKTLVFRSDRLGDFIISSPFIISYKKKFPNNKIIIISSDYNYDYIKDFDFVDLVIPITIFSNFIKKLYNLIKLIIKFRKNTYKDIIVLDGKNRSFFIAMFLKGKKFMFLKSDFLISLSKILNIKYVFNFDIQKQIKNLDYLANLIGFKVNHNKIDIYKNFNFSTNKESLPKKYILLHLDEKWYSETYHHDYTNINPNYYNLTLLLEKIIDNTNCDYDIIISTGAKRLKIYDEIGSNFQLSANKTYKKLIKNKLVYFIENNTFHDLEYYIKHSSLLICCEGAVSHVSHNLKIPTVAFYEESRYEHINHWTGHMSNIKLHPRKNILDVINDKLFLRIIDYKLKNKKI